MPCVLLLRLCLHGSQVQYDIIRLAARMCMLLLMSAMTTCRSMGCGTSPASKATWAHFLSAMFVWSGTATWQRASTSASPTCEASQALYLLHVCPSLACVASQRQCLLTQVHVSQGLACQRHQVSTCAASQRAARVAPMLHKPPCHHMPPVSVVSPVLTSKLAAYSERAANTREAAPSAARLDEWLDAGGMHPADARALSRAAGR